MIPSLNDEDKIYGSSGKDVRALTVDLFCQRTYAYIHNHEGFGYCEPGEYEERETHMTTLSTKRGSSWFQLYLFSMLLVLLAGCASTQPHQPSPFFLTEKEIETHGRKTWYDRIMDADPGSTSFVIAGDYQERPPRKIAVLPFVDEGKGTYLIDKISIKTRDKEELTKWSWTHTNRVRRAFAGDLATREFVLVPLLTVDAVLAHHGITDRDKLNAVPPEELGRWLGADTVVYGELLSYEAYYLFFLSAWRVSARVRMVSTLDGHEIFSCTSRRFDSTFRPAIAPIDFAINSFSSLIHLRDITLARTEYEVGREIVLRLPRAQRNISELQAVTKEETRGSDIGHQKEKND